MYTLNDVKEEARKDGYNVSEGDFRLEDWNVLKIYLDDEKNIHTRYRSLKRDIAFGKSILDPDLEFIDNNKLFIHAGMKYGKIETLTFSKPVEISVNGELKKVTSMEVFLSQNEIVSIKAEFPISITSPSFSITYPTGSSPEEPPVDKVNAICGQAICGKTICGELNVSTN